MVIDLHRQYYILCVYYFYSYTLNYDNLGNTNDRIERYKAYYPTPYINIIHLNKTTGLYCEYLVSSFLLKSHLFLLKLILIQLSFLLIQGIQKY